MCAAVAEQRLVASATPLGLNIKCGGLNQHLDNAASERNPHRLVIGTPPVYFIPKKKNQGSPIRIFFGRRSRVLRWKEGGVDAREPGIPRAVNALHQSHSVQDDLIQRYCAPRGNRLVCVWEMEIVVSHTLLPSHTDRIRPVRSQGP